MFKPRFRYKQRVLITKGFYADQIGVALLRWFVWFPWKGLKFGNNYLVRSEPDNYGRGFESTLSERILASAPEKPLVVTHDGVLKEGK